MRRAASAAVAAVLAGGLLTVPASAAQARKGADRTPPRLTVSSYAVRDNTLTVAVAASDASGVRGVRLLVRGKVVATDNTAPYELTADLSGLTGEVKWKVRAIDKRGNGRDSDERKSRVKPRGGDRPRPTPTVSPSVAPSVAPSVSPSVSPSPDQTRTPEPGETD